MKRAIIFDLDGTLVDSVADIAAAMNHCLRAVGAPEHPVDAYLGFVGHGSIETTRQAFPPGTSDAKIREIAAAFNARYGDHCLERTGPFDGVQGALDALAAAGIPMSVLSNKPDHLTRMMIERLFPADTFAAVAGARDDTPKKPAPDAALAQARLMGAAPGDVWFVGDTPVDIGTAVAAGMRAVGVTWGFRRPADLTAAGAEWICPTPADLRQLAAR